MGSWSQPASWREKAEEENRAGMPRQRRKQGRNAKAELSGTALTWSCSHSLVSITRTGEGILGTQDNSVPCWGDPHSQRPHINGLTRLTGHYNLLCTGGFLPGRASLPAAELCGKDGNQTRAGGEGATKSRGARGRLGKSQPCKQPLLLSTAGGKRSWWEVLLDLGAPEVKRRSQSWSHRQGGWKLLQTGGEKQQVMLGASPADLWVKEKSAQHHRSVGFHLKKKNPT